MSDDDEDSEKQFIDMQNVVMEELQNEQKLQDFQCIPVTQGQSPSLPMIQYSRKVLPIEQEELLIKKLIDGEMTFSDYNQQIGQIVDDNIDEPDEIEEDSDNNDEEMSHSAGTSSTNFEKELIQSRRDAIKGNLKGRSVDKDGKIQRRRCVLPIALQGLMGEANLCYARGQNELAEKVCLEIIRQVPLAPEPFLTLAQIYEGNADKYMQFSLIAAHLNPSDIDQWVRIAQMSLEQGNIKQAINCYMKASRYNPKDIDVRLQRIELLKSIGEEKLAFRCFYSMLLNIPAEQGAFLLETAKTAANQLVKEGNVAKALDALSTAYAKVSQLFQTEDINFYLELLIANGAYRTVLDVLCRHAGLEVCFAESGVEGDTVVKDCIIPAEIMLDFRAKLMVSLIHLRAFHLLEYLFKNIFAFISVEEAGDCYLDIAEALMKVEQYSEALRLLVPLVKSKNFSLAAVWLRHADCCRAIGLIEDAIVSYRQVVQLAPQHFDARLTLSALLKQLGRSDEAMVVLEQDMDNEIIDPYVLYERCFMLKESGCLDQYVDVGYVLLSRHCVRLRNREEMQIATTIVKFSSKLTLIRENREAKGEPTEDSDGPEFGSSTNEPTVQAEWDLFRDIVQTAYDRRRYAKMQKIVFTLTTSRRFAPYQRELDFMSFLASLYNRDSRFSFLHSKEFVTRHMDVPRVWNLFNVVLQFSEDIPYRFLLRLFKRNEMQDVVPLTLRGNYFLMSGSYKYAINEYMAIYRECNSPLITLLIAITYSHLAQQKFIQKKHSLIAQSLAFATEYERLRSTLAFQEVHYNLGRLHQQFGIAHIAVYHYEKVLGYDNALIRERPDLLNLKQEAAFNLHLIYMASGNMNLARKYLYDYIIV